MVEQPYLLIDYTVMKRQLLLFLIFPFSVCAQLHTAEKVFKKVNNAVVKLYSYNNNRMATGQGSGVILKSKKWLITNAHNATGSILVAEHNGKEILLDSVLLLDNETDLMVIRIETKTGKELDNIPDLKIFNSDNITIGQRIYAIGSPLDFENSISEGIVSGIRIKSDTLKKMIQITAPISGGSSGGAVVDAKGRLLGISSMQMAGQGVQNINFAIPVNDVFETLEHGPKKPSRNDYKNRMLKADEEFNMNHYEHALSNYYSALSTKLASTDDFYKTRYMMGRCYMNLYVTDSAIACFTDSKKYKPLKTMSYYFLGYVHTRAKQFEKARLAFKLAIMLDSTYADAYTGLAFLYFKKNEMDNALTWIGKSISIDKNNSNTNYVMARLLLQQGMHDKGIELLEGLVSINKNFAEGYYFLADAYLNKGNTDKAFEMQQKAYRLNPFFKIRPPD